MFGWPLVPEHSEVLGTILFFIYFKLSNFQKFLVSYMLFSCASLFQNFQFDDVVDIFVVCELVFECVDRNVVIVQQRAPIIKVICSHLTVLLDLSMLIVDGKC